MKNQQNSSKGIINTDLKFDGTYQNYFQWILNAFEAQEKTKYDLFLFKNTKYLAYRFNDFQNLIDELLIKVRHSVVTDNYLAGEEIQNQNWQYFIERVIEVCKSKEANSTIKPTEEFLLTTLENVTVAKKPYETFYNVVAKNFYTAMSKISVDEQKKIREDLLSKNYWWKDCMKQLNSWIAFYYHFGRFPGSPNWTNVPHVNMPIFLKTEMPLSPFHLYKKFVETDAKGLVSLHGLAALNIYLGGNPQASQTAFSEFLKNLTYQALSQENDDMFLSSDDAIYLVESIFNAFIDREKNEIEKTSQSSEKIQSKLDTKFHVIEAPAMQIQLGEEESEIEDEPQPVEFSTPLEIEEINEIYDRKKGDFLKIALKLNQIDLESLSEVADSENEALIQEIINPTPGLVINDDMNVDTQFSF